MAATLSFFPDLIAKAEAEAKGSGKKELSPEERKKLAEEKKRLQAEKEQQKEAAEYQKEQEAAVKKFIPEVKEAAIKAYRKKVNVEQINGRYRELILLERKLTEKEAQLKQMEIQIIDQVKKLKQAQLDYTNSLVKEKRLSKDRLTKLVKTFSKMDVKSAAPAIEAMEKQLAIQLLLNIKEAQLSKLFEKMSAQKVAEFSESLARFKKDSN